MISTKLPLAPIQDKEGILTFSYNNHEFVIDVNEYNDRKYCLEELERISGKHFSWCKENFGLHHWVLYDMSMYYFDTVSLRYKSECHLLPTIPINATSCNCMFAYCNDIDLSQFNTVNIIDMSGMFYNYTGDRLNVSMLVTDNVRDLLKCF